MDGDVEHYSNVHLNSSRRFTSRQRTRLRAVRMLTGRQQEIHAERDWKLEEARKQRQIRRQQSA
jgi:hypothetical protein